MHICYYTMHHKRNLTPALNGGQGGGLGVEMTMELGSGGLVGGGFSQFDYHRHLA